MRLRYDRPSLRPNVDTAGDAKGILADVVICVRPQAHDASVPQTMTESVEPVRELLRRRICFLLTTLQPGENVQLTKHSRSAPSAFTTFERPMKIEIVVDPSSLPSQSLARRVALVPVTLRMEPLTPHCTTRILFPGTKTWLYHPVAEGLGVDAGVMQGGEMNVRARWQLASTSIPLSFFSRFRTINIHLLEERGRRIVVLSLPALCLT